MKMNFYYRKAMLSLLCVQGLMTDASSTKHLQFPGLLEKLAYFSWTR